MEIHVCHTAMASEVMHQKDIDTSLPHFIIIIIKTKRCALEQKLLLREPIGSRI